jgi:hypothetical protein
MHLVIIRAGDGGHHECALVGALPASHTCLPVKPVNALGRIWGHRSPQQDKNWYIGEIRW